MFNPFFAPICVADSPFVDGCSPNIGVYAVFSMCYWFKQQFF